MSGFDDNPFLASLGAHIEEWVDDQVTISLAVQPAHLNRQGVMQGGLVCSLLDTACGYAGISTNDPARAQGVTISLAINFLGSVRGGHGNSGWQGDRARPQDLFFPGGNSVARRHGYRHSARVVQVWGAQGPG